MEDQSVLVEIGVGEEELRCDRKRVARETFVVMKQYRIFIVIAITGICTCDKIV